MDKEIDNLQIEKYKHYRSHIMVQIFLSLSMLLFCFVFFTLFHYIAETKDSQSKIHPSAWLWCLLNAIQFAFCAFILIFSFYILIYNKEHSYFSFKGININLATFSLISAACVLLLMPCSFLFFIVNLLHINDIPNNIFYALNYIGILIFLLSIALDIVIITKIKVPKKSI